MTVLFAGPSIYGSKIDFEGIDVRPPAVHGDIAKATLQGATIIGLADGNFEAVASIWHKEILFALSEGVVVAGAASMGALRAAECQKFGMVPIGLIAKEYAQGIRDDDADVAMLQCPAEMEFRPLTLTVVDVHSTVVSMLGRAEIDKSTARRMLNKCHDTYFKERTIETLVLGLDDPDGMRQLFKSQFVNQKQKDVAELVTYMRTHELQTEIKAPCFQMEQPETWRRALGRIAEESRMTSAQQS